MCTAGIQKPNPKINVVRMSRRTPGTALTAMGETGARFSDDGGGGARPSAPARSTAKTMAPERGQRPAPPVCFSLERGPQERDGEGPDARSTVRKS